MEYKICNNAIYLMVTVIFTLLLGCNAGTNNNSNQAAVSKPVDLTSQRFSGFYPTGCTLNSTKIKILDSCICIQDIKTHDIWYTQAYNSNNNWNVINVWANGLNTANNGTGTCGIAKGWGLPSHKQLETIAGYVPNSYYILNNGASWFNANGFRNIKNTIYWGAACNGQNSCPEFAAWTLNIMTGAVYSMRPYLTLGGLAVVHPEQ